MLMQKLKAVIQMIRPELPLAAGVCVVLGQALALGALPRLSQMISGFLVGFFLSSSAMIFNDYFDLEVDRVNAPERPLPSGLLSPREALAWGLSAALVALALALFLNPLTFSLCLLTWILGFLYNWRYKSAGLPGNLMVSTSVAMTFLVGGASVRGAGSFMLWIFSLVAFIFDLAEEIAGDAMDMDGDRKRASRSLAIVYGKRTALRISTILFFSMVLLTFVPVLLGEVGLAYLIPIVVMDVLIVFFTIRLAQSETPQQGRSAMRGAYLTASLGLLAFILSQFVS